MNNLYGRLFRYRARPDREPLENFLSEALADLLSRMPRAESLALLRHAFDQSGVTGFVAKLTGMKFEWVTQKAVPGGILDLVLMIDGIPRLIIENKTWSGFQDHSTDENLANQLHTYCEWLSRECPISAESGMLLVTGTRSSPAAFHDGAGSYQVSRRAQITWAEIGRWLDGRSRASHDESTWRELALELVAFLREKKLSSEVFLASDVSAAHLMMPTMERWNATFSTIWEASQNEWQTYLSPRVGDLLFKPDGGLFWHWRYSQLPSPSAKAWVALGIRFPDQSNWYEGLDLPSAPHFIFIVASDKGELKCSSEIPPDWRYSEEDGHYLLAREVSSFGDQPDERI